MIGSLISLLSLTAFTALAQHDTTEQIVPAGATRGFHTLQQIADGIDALVAAAPDITAKRTLGRTMEGRDILALCVGRCEDWTPQPGVHSVLFTALHHSREPLGSLVSLFYADSLVRKWLHGDRATVALLARRALIVVPAVNPDGYQWNLQHINSPSMRMVRKNRRRACAHGTVDVGIDINRNYDFAFDHDNDGSNPDPCAEDYRGAAPFSEPETAAIRDLVLHARPALAVNWHSFGRFVNLPYAVRDFGSPPPEIYDTFLSLGRGIGAVSGFGYGHPYDGGLYSCNGEASDWMLNATGTFAMSPELGPQMNEEFDAGMWPSVAKLRTLVPEGQTVAHRALLAGGPLIEVDYSDVSLDACASSGSDSAACSQLTLTVKLKNNGVRDAQGELVVALVDAAGVIADPALCSSDNADCALRLHEAGVSMCADGTLSSVLPECPAIAPEVTGADLRGSAASGRTRQLSVGSAEIGDNYSLLFERPTLKRTEAVMKLIAERKRKQPAINSNANAADFLAKIDLAEIEAEVDEQLAVHGRHLQRQQRRQLQSVAGAISPLGLQLNVSAVRLRSASGSGLASQHVTAPLVLSVPVPVRSDACAASAGTLAAATCLQAGGPTSALASKPPVAVLAVSDEVSCDLYAISCSGEVILLQRDQSGCGVCAMLRSSSWASVLAMPSPSAPPPSMGGQEAPSASGTAAATVPPSGTGTAAATSSPAGTPSSSSAATRLSSAAAASPSSSAQPPPSPSASASSSPAAVIVEPSPAPVKPDGAGAEEAQPSSQAGGQRQPALPWPWDEPSSMPADSQVNAYLLAAGASFLLVTSLLWKPLARLARTAHAPPAAEQAMRIETAA